MTQNRYSSLRMLRMCMTVAAGALAGCEEVEAPENNFVTVTAPVPLEGNLTAVVSQSDPEFNTATGATGDYDPYRQRGGTPTPPLADAPKWPEPEEHAIVDPGETPRN